MRSVLIVVVVLVGLQSGARADEFQTRETFGLDVATLWEPRNRDAFGAGPMLRYEFHSTKMADWFAITSRFGMFVDSADRVFMPFTFGVQADLGVPYVGVEIGGWLFPPGEDSMDSLSRLGSTIGASLGVRLGNWDLHALWMRGNIFDGNVWSFALGRNFGLVEATVKRKTF